jgi:hypothetical protein
MTFPCEKSFEPIVTAEQLIQKTMRLCTRHGACGSEVLLVRVWVILDRPPNDPFLRKKEPFTSS